MKSTINNLLILALIARLTLSAPVATPVPAPGTSPAIGAGKTPLAKRARYLNCTYATEECARLGAICMNDDYALSNNEWCVLNCRCDYVYECPGFGGCRFVQPGGEAGGGEAGAETGGAEAGPEGSAEAGTEGGEKKTEIQE